MNINLTTYCNLKCPYCFARDLADACGNKPEDKELTLDNLKIILSFMKRSGLRWFRMIGGEPTLHSKFEEIYDRVSSGGFYVTIFSNGIIAEEKVKFLEKQVNLKDVCINIQPRQAYSQRQKEAIDFSLSRLNRLVNLSFVIYRNDFDPRFIITLVTKYNLRREIKISIACPSLVNKNVYIKLSNHKQIIRRMCSLSGIFKKHRISWYPDTTYMWCLFSKKQLGRLSANVGFSPANLCTPVLEVAPNLNVYRCYGAVGITRPGLKLTDFRNEKDAYGYFLKKDAILKRVGALNDCPLCDLKGGVCGGGCIVQILKTIPNRTKGYIY